MPSTINLAAVVIANVMGITILFAASRGHFWIAKDAAKETLYIKILFFSSFISCIADPICFIADGKPGLINRILVIGCNSWLYIGNIITSIVWILFICAHMKVKLAPWHKRMLYLFGICSVLLIVLNLLTPILFYVTEDNVYSRTDFYLFYSALFMLLTLDCLIQYLYVRRKSGHLKFFPVWAFLIPAVIGYVIQSVHYGVSTITPFMTVSITCVIISIQNEFLCRDSLTGLYNRFYLDTLKKRLGAKAKDEYMAMMLDINGFKRINDVFGHKVGDDVLIILSDILTGVVGKSGEVIRYAGDEFIIILNMRGNDDADRVVSLINSSIDDFNKTEKIPCELSVAIGFEKIYFDENSSGELLDRIDKLMYENKKKYYETHSRYEIHK